VIVPLLIYCGVVGRWKPSLAYAAVAALYGTLAILVLYPWANGVSVFQHQAGKADLGSILKSFTVATAGQRLEALFWIVLPAVPLLRRGWRPLLVIPSAAVLMTLASAWPPQFTMRFQHPAPVMACLAVALVEALARSAAEPAARRATGHLVLAVYLVAITLASNYWRGFLPGSRSVQDVYRHVGVEGTEALWVARHQLPKDGVLLTSQPLVGFAANRADVITWDFFQPGRHAADVVFERIDVLTSQGKLDSRRLLENGEFGVRFYDGTFVVLQRGFAPAQNADVLEAWTQPVIRFAYTHGDAGQDRYSPGGTILRYWSGHNVRLAPCLARDKTVRLEAGRYAARFRLRVGPASAGTTASRGTLSVYTRGARTCLVEAPIQPAAGGGPLPGTHTLEFQIDSAADVEPRVIGGAVPLWLDRVIFERIGSATGMPGTSRS
jgi:hypothetical protein